MSPAKLPQRSMDALAERWFCDQPSCFSPRFLIFPVPRPWEPDGQLCAAISSNLPQELRKIVGYEAVVGPGCFQFVCFSLELKRIGQCV